MITTLQNLTVMRRRHVRSGEPMLFRVGTLFYRLLIVPAPLVWNGRERAALASSHDQLIRISADVSLDQRLTTLMHELRHCWSFHFHLPACEEGECEFCAQIYTAAFEDLNDQGGVEALKAMSAE